MIWPSISVGITSPTTKPHQQCCRIQSIDLLRALAQLLEVKASRPLHRFLASFFDQCVVNTRFGALSATQSAAPALELRG